MQDFNARVLRRGEEVASWMTTCYTLKWQEKEREFLVSEHDGAVVHWHTSESGKSLRLPWSERGSAITSGERCWHRPALPVFSCCLGTYVGHIFRSMRTHILQCSNICETKRRLIISTRAALRQKEDSALYQPKILFEALAPPDCMGPVNSSEEG
jgi:hypothetical protein